MRRTTEHQSPRHPSHTTPRRAHRRPIPRTRTLLALGALGAVLSGGLGGCGDGDRGPAGPEGPAGAQGPAGPAGPAGTSGISSLELRTAALPVPALGPASATATCPAGKKVTGGGWSGLGPGLQITQSYPAATLQGWTVDAHSLSGIPHSVTVYALCATVT
jgi:hypothetical protein